MQDNLAYSSHLFDDTTDGYIQLIKLNNGKCIKIYNTQNKALRTIIEEVQGQEDVYISSNTYYKPGRSISYIRQFRALYIDLDIKEYGKAETVYMVYLLAEEKKIPLPSMIISSGRGIHLYWRIKNAPYGALYTWQNLEDYLYHQLKHLGADLKATDGARVLRLPGTINSKNNAQCNIITVNDDIEYSMRDLREDYLIYKVKNHQLEFHQAKKNKKNKCISNKFFNSYSLHYSRSKDIQTLCKLRNYDVKGYRNFILHCYAYWEGIYTRNLDELENKVIELNNSFKSPLRQAEVNAILRCIPKAIEKFICYEQGLNSGQCKRITKGMRNKQGYWYKNETLIERLDISSEEQRHMKTIIGTEEKYKRNNINRRNIRRNKEGLTLREQQKAEKVQAVKELYNQGIKQKEIAEKLNISKQLVNHYIKLIQK